MKNETELKRVSIQVAMCPGTCGSDEACKVCQYTHEQNCTDLLKRDMLRLIQVPQEPEARTNQTQLDLKTRVTQIMHELGIPASIMGYRYTWHAIMLVVQDPSIINSMTKRLYPEVAKHFGSTGSRVERSIRHAIEIAWERGDVDVLQKWFGWTISNKKGKPTNTEFLGLVADAIMLEVEREAE